MHFRLTYSGPLYSYQREEKEQKRVRHVHDIRKIFHKQLKYLWTVHPVLIQHREYIERTKGQAGENQNERISNHGFEWFPIASNRSGLVCRLKILLLRVGKPGRVLTDIDNRIKILFDALRCAHSASELGASRESQKYEPDEDECPFYVLLEDDNLITEISVETDMLLEPVLRSAGENDVRLFISVEIRPYNTNMSNLDYA